MRSQWLVIQCRWSVQSHADVEHLRPVGRSTEDSLRYDRVFSRNRLIDQAQLLDIFCKGNTAVGIATTVFGTAAARTTLPSLFHTSRYRLCFVAPFQSIRFDSSVSRARRVVDLALFASRAPFVAFDLAFPTVGTAGRPWRHHNESMRRRE